MSSSRSSTFWLHRWVMVCVNRLYDDFAPQPREPLLFAVRFVQLAVQPLDQQPVVACVLSPAVGQPDQLAADRGQFGLDAAEPSEARVSRLASPKLTFSWLSRSVMLRIMLYSSELFPGRFARSVCFVLINASTVSF